MKATLNVTSKVKGTTSYNGGRECVRAWSVCVHDSTDGCWSVATVRWYMGRSRSAMTVYCDLFGPYCEAAGRSITANGRAGGGGYDKYSASLADAIRNAGLALDEDIAGVGDGASESAILAICALAGHERAAVIRSL